MVEQPFNVDKTFNVDKIVGNSGNRQRGFDHLAQDGSHSINSDITGPPRPTGANPARAFVLQGIGDILIKTLRTTAQAEQGIRGTSVRKL